MEEVILTAKEEVLGAKLNPLEVQEEGAELEGDKLGGMQAASNHDAKFVP